MQTRDAERILREQRASRGYSSCFVNPNATCPVCQAAVFYYQNDRGSRVFFDELGPLWPKHGCTDNPRLSVTISSDRPRPRARGMRLELTEAASFLGLYDGGRYHKSGYAIDWQMIEITSVDRRGFQLFLTGNLIEMADAPVVNFSITCPDDIIAESDVVSGCFSTLSVFHRGKARPRQYQVLWFEDERFLKVISTGEHTLKPLAERKIPTDSETERPASTFELIPRSKIRRARPKVTTPPERGDPRKAEARRAPKRPNRNDSEPKLPGEKTAEPKPKTAKQAKRDEMILNVVVEYRRDRQPKAPKAKR